MSKRKEPAFELPPRKLDIDPTFGGFCKKFSHYSAAFKREGLERIERESLSDQQAATLYDIRHAGAIGIWRGRYDVGGVGALAPQPKGRRPMPHKYP
jgi:transposase